jgi:membrane associated rhomboid family serine protease
MGPDRSNGVTPWVARLLVANLIAYLLKSTLFWAPRFLVLFGFSPLHFWTRPWTLVTYQFVHASIWHLAFNLLALYFFGPPVEARLGGRRFIGFYLMCGLGGALLSALLVTVVGDQLVIGASGAILGVAVAFAWYWPDAPVLVVPFPEPFAAKWLVIFTIGVSIVLAWLGARTGVSDGVSYLAHLGGIGTALLMLKVADWRVAGHERALRRSSVPNAVVSSAALVARSSDPSHRPTGESRRRPAERTQAEIDRVLDKISANGIASLTPAERKFLAEMSRRMRDQG